MPHVPSLQTLRAFEAAGRHRSYSRAADELGLTHGAISHRIRALEDQTGARLFVRQGNGMIPTSEGHRLLAQVRHALTLLEAAFVKRPQTTAITELTISVLPSFASRWLVPRLGQFRGAYPEISVRVIASSELVSFGPLGPDAGLRYGPGGWPSVSARRLASELLFPVCAPAYAERLGLFHPDDLSRAVLLRHSWQPWAPWLHRVGSNLAEPTDGPIYAESDLLLAAAVAGEGVALGRRLLANDDLAQGRLVSRQSGGRKCACRWRLHEKVRSSPQTMPSPDRVDVAASFVPEEPAFVRCAQGSVLAGTRRQITWSGVRTVRL